MSIDLRTQSELKRILLNSNGNKKNKPESQELEAEENVQVVAPEAKEITASISDVLAMQNMVMISTSRTTPIPSGSYELPEGRVVVHENEDGNIGFQYKGKGSLSLNELGKLVRKGLTPVQDEPTANGVNGEIDESVKKGGTGDCWVLTGILSLTATAEGKALIKSSLEIQKNGDVIVNFKGLGYSIRVTAAEIKKHDTDDIKNDAFSNGDNDMLVFELAVEKLFEQHPELKETYGYNEEGKGDDKYITQGGFGNDLVEWLSSNKAEDLCTMDKLENPYDKADVAEWVAVPSSMTRYQGEYPRPSSISLDAMFNDDKTNFSSEYINWYNKTFVPIMQEYNQSALNGLVDGLSQEEVMAKLQEAYENQPCAMTFGLYVFANDTEKTAKDVDGNNFIWKYYSQSVEKGELCGHAFAVVGMTQDTITFVNPWDSTEKITMSWEEFSKLGIGRIAYNKLDKVEDTTEPATPTTPTVDSDTEHKTKLISQIESDVERYLHTMVADNQADVVRKEFNKLITGDENTNFHQYLHTQDLDVTKLEEIATAVANKINATVPNEPVTPDPVIPDTPADNGVAELLAQGFTQADIDEYFDKTEDGKYELKSGIKFSYYATVQDRIRQNKTEVEITSIDQLKDFCGANKRLELLNEGWPEEMLDKYFEKTTDFLTGKQTYAMKPEKNNVSIGTISVRPNYTITTDDSGNKTIEFTKDNSKVTITVKPDGSYTESIVGIKVGPSIPTQAKQELLDKGFTEKQISEWFTLYSDGTYSLKTNRAIATGDYANSYIEFKSVEELSAYIGADSRVALRNQGMPDDIIDKFFELKRTGADGSFSYELKVEGNYTITDQGENKLIRIQNKEDDTITEILVKKDGTYTIETSEIINIGDSDDAKAVAGSANELLAQGFTQSDIDKYFYKKNNQYFLRSDITFRKEVFVEQKGNVSYYDYENVNITTLEELKEYSGANSRKALQDKGLPDELIDKYYRKEEGRDGKIAYHTDKPTSLGKDGNNTVFTIDSDGGGYIDNDGNITPKPTREYTIKPDGTYTVVEYTYEQITDTTRTHYMLTEKGLSESDIKKFFTEKDGLYTLKKGIMYKGQYINSVEALVDVLNKNK